MEDEDGYMDFSSVQDAIPFVKGGLFDIQNRTECDLRKMQVRNEMTYGDDVMNDSETYWASIYLYSSDREEANRIIKSIAEDGVFLVRNGSQGDKVLVVFADCKTRKFRIEQGPSGFYLNSNHTVIYKTIEELLHHYYTTCLPGYNVYLNIPYKLHPDFRPEMIRS